MTLEVGNIRQPRDGPDAQPRHRSYRLGDTEKATQEALLIEGDPAHSPSLCCAGEPQILDGEAHRIQAGVRDGVTAEDARRSPVGVVGDDDAQARLGDAVDLDPGERACPFAFQGCGEPVTLGLHVCMEGAPRIRVSHDDEVPWLRQSDARGGMGCGQDPVKDGRVDRFAGKFSTDISAAEDDVVEGDLRYGAVAVALLVLFALFALFALLALACQVVDHSPSTLPRLGMVDAQVTLLTLLALFRDPAGQVACPTVTSQQNAPSDGIWQGDACSLVDAFREGSITPPEALEMSLQAIEHSDLNAFCHIDAEGAHLAASAADIELPFGGVPIGVKELDPVKGWPYSEGSLVFKDRMSGHTSTMVERLSGAGAVLVGQTTASEFGGVNYTHTRIHGTTCNPWNTERTPGGSSGGTAAAVAGGLVTLGTAGDGGGSIRIPAGFTGMFGLKATFGRIPRGPQCMHPPLTVTVGCVSRSVRDTARWFDVCNGHDARDSLSLPRVDMWESDLGKVARRAHGQAGGDLHRPRKCRGEFPSCRGRSRCRGGAHR